MYLASLINDFFLFGVLGWVYECVYCTIRTGHWQNRGFLFGPICPIYGIGAVSIIVLSMLVPEMTGGELPMWECYLIFLFGSAALEYSVSWGLERVFHARWWDYSDMPLNLNGRICLPASALFGAAGILFLKYLIPLADAMQAHTYPVIIEASALLAMALLGADAALSAASMTALLETLDAIESNVNERLENGVQLARNIPGKVSSTVATASGRTRDAVLLLPCRAKSAAKHMFQRHHLNNVSRFVRKGHTKAADYVRQYVHRKDDHSETLKE